MDRGSTAEKAIEWGSQIRSYVLPYPSPSIDRTELKLQ